MPAVTRLCSHSNQILGLQIFFLETTGNTTHCLTITAKLQVYCNEITCLFYNYEIRHRKTLCVVGINHDWENLVMFANFDPLVIELITV